MPNHALLGTAQKLLKQKRNYWIVFGQSCQDE